jgi:glycosyltransferase involved in cell wall biosynthesis
VLEALACGLPVVTTQAGEVGELIREGTNGFVSGSGEPEDLATLLSKVVLIHGGDAVAATVAHLEMRTVIARLFDALGEPPGVDRRRHG